MKNVSIFFYWLITVVLGSILFGVSLSLIDNNFNDAGDSLMLILISAMSSAVISMPALITFFITNNKFKRQFSETKTYQKKMYLAHLITGLVYAFVSIFLNVIINFDTIVISVILGLLICYLPVGLISWHFGFKNSHTVSIHDEDIIDSPTND